jgi:ribose 5-phosphate isomerase A
MDIKEQKKSAAQYSLKFIPPHGKVGIGTGSTIKFLIDLLGENKDYFKDVIFIPTSDETGQLLSEYGLSVSVSLSGRIVIDIDGADEIDPAGNLIKGGGGALTREKIVAYNSEQFVVIADSSKYVNRLGKFKLPIEIIPFLAEQTIAHIEKLGAKVQLRDDGEFKTNNGNLIAIADFGIIGNMNDISVKLSCIPGIVEHGLFLKMADRSIEGTEHGVREHLYFKKND